jgi:CubicO group peptidase (beta-lactamase class C family)
VNLPGDLDGYISKALDAWEVPGLAISLVKGDSVVYAKGYGIREAGQQNLVDERTLFAIGSATKAFTAAALAILVDEGGLDWDDPVNNHLPDLQLFDPWVTRELTVRDLLTHRTGLARHEAVWLGKTAGIDEILGCLRHVKPSWSFRSRAGYQNAMYLVAGRIIRCVTGIDWADFVRERILLPLGMTSTNTSVHALGDEENAAAPHARIGGMVLPVSWHCIDVFGPAGSINSNVEEMARWVGLNLREGVYGRQRLLSPAVVREMHTPHVMVNTMEDIAALTRSIDLGTNFWTYGLGWFVSDYRGRKTIWHLGDVNRMSAAVGLVPAEEVGLAILSNMDSCHLAQALMYQLFDVCMGAPGERDWSSVFLRWQRAMEARVAEAQRRMQEARVHGTNPSLHLSAYTGTFINQAYGQAAVGEENGTLVVQFDPTYPADLEHWHYDTFLVKWRDPILARTLLTFRVGAEGTVKGLEIQDLHGMPAVYDAYQDS